MPVWLCSRRNHFTQVSARAAAAGSGSVGLPTKQKLFFEFFLLDQVHGLSPSQSLRLGEWESPGPTEAAAAHWQQLAALNLHPGTTHHYTLHLQVFFGPESQPDHDGLGPGRDHDDSDSLIPGLRRTG